MEELIIIDSKRLARIADRWVNDSGQVKPGEHVVINYDFEGCQLARLVAKRCLKKGARVTTQVSDSEMGEILAKSASDRDIMRAGAFRDLQIYEADVMFFIRVPSRLNVLSSVPADRMKLVNKMNSTVAMNYRVNYTRWQLIYLPTRAEAEADGLSYEEYVDLWINAADQPWDEIEEAQEHLTAILDKGRELTLIANPNDIDENRRTKLTMSIDGMTFINSTIDNNFPGSEVFSSPVRDSINGQLFAGGSYCYNGRIFKDVYLKIENGKIVAARAAENGEELQKVLDADEGARYFGEVAFGTNPGLRRRLFNALLNEKVGGSFHITPGKAYEDTIADGKHVDNGNRSQIHWDITIMMLPIYGGGEVLVDGKTIQKDGRFLDSQLEILNTGLV